MSTDLRDRLAQVLDRDRLRRAAVARRSVQRDQIQKLKEDIARLQEHHAAKEALQRHWNSNGHGGHQGERLIEVPEAPNVQAERAAAHGGQRKPEGWLHGVPFYQEEE